MARKNLGTSRQENELLIKETAAAPSETNGYATIYAKSNTNSLYYKRDDGTELKIADSGPALGASQGLEQQILANSGQIGKTVLAVGYTYFDGSEGPIVNTKAQIASLADGNVVFVYATGEDYTNNVVQEGPIFLGLGEPYVIENVQAGTIIESTGGAYGYSQQKNGNSESPMPLLSLGLAFKETFFFAFRNCGTYAPNTAATSQGYVNVVNGPLASTVKLTNGSGATIQGQENVILNPWQYHRFYTDGDIEYKLVADNKIMACTAANMSTTSPGFYDSRLILPVTNDGITWPRSGQMSAPYSATNVKYWVNDGAAWDVGAGAILSIDPGTPKDIDAAQPTGTGAGDADYEPRGATRFKAAGLVSAYSGADSAGLEASPMCPVSNFTQRIALPLRIENFQDGGNNGIAIASPYEGTARLYEWNTTTSQADLVGVQDVGSTSIVESIAITRRSGTVTAPNDQNYPASALIAPSDAGGGGVDPDSYGLTSAFTGGYIEADVPICVVFNSNGSENGESDTYRGTSGAAVVGIAADDDEQLSFGITPETIKAEITLDLTYGLLYKRTVTVGTTSWSLA